MDEITSPSTVTAPVDAQDERNLPVSRNIKIGLFHLGSGMADVMITGAWNRIMISDLGFAATPIALLGSLRYFLAPLGIWAGRVSDQRAIGGYRRLFWVWLGRGMMLLSMISLGFLTANLARGGEATAPLWIGMIVSLTLFSLGNAISGSTFLALVYDRAPEAQRGRAVGIVWTFLLVGFTVGGILFAVMLPSKDPAKLLKFGGDTLESIIPLGEGLYGDLLSFTPDTLQMLFIVAGLIMGALWFFSLLGEEKRSSGTVISTSDGENERQSSAIMADLKLVWEMHPMRLFAVYLALSMLFAFSQDIILEPFAGDVFGMSAQVTTRFSAYWGSMAILGTLVFLWLSRRRKGLTNTLMSYMGVGVLMVAFGVFAFSALAEVRGLVTPGLILLGIGLGIWNVGTLGLMMDMSPLKRAGTFLGFWSLLVTFARGLGVSSGGIVRDIALTMTGNPKVSYAVVFIIGAVGLGVSYWALTQVNVREYKAESMPSDAAQVFAGAMD